VEANTRAESFGRSGRLRRRVDFLMVQERGRRIAGANYLVFGLPRSAPLPGLTSKPRLGITVSRKVGGAVTRNRVKRWVRESYRRLRPLAPEATDVVVVARPPAAASSYEVTKEELASLLKKLARR
jgi:ribonuclease P protein component